MLKKLVAMLLAVLVIMGVVASPVMAYDSNPTFSDVPATHWAYAAIEEMASKGIVAGVGDGKFNPNGNVTTAQFATMMVRAFYPDELAADNQTYPAWYGKTMHIALNEGILNRLPAVYTCNGGLENWNSKYVNNSMTRKEMAVMLSNYIKNYIKLDEETFNKMSLNVLQDYESIAGLPYYYFNSIKLVYNYGIITGVDVEGTFNGDGLMTRAQACAVLKRALDLVASYGGQYIDNSNIKLYNWLDYSCENDRLNPGETLTNGKAITPENVTELIYSLKSKYPEGMPSDDELGFEVGDDAWVSACAAFGLMVDKDIFGDYDSYSNGYYSPEYDTIEFGKQLFNTIRPGDNLRLNGYHTVVVIERNANSLKIVEGNYDGKVHWGRNISLNSFLKMDVQVCSPYPYMEVK